MYGVRRFAASQRPKGLEYNLNSVTICHASRHRAANHRVAERLRRIVSTPPRSEPASVGLCGGAGVIKLGYAGLRRLAGTG